MLPSVRGQTCEAGLAAGPHLGLPLLQLRELLVNVVLQACELSITRCDLPGMPCICCLAVQKQLQHLQISTGVAKGAGLQSQLRLTLIFHD